LLIQPFSGLHFLNFFQKPSVLNVIIVLLLFSSKSAKDGAQTTLHCAVAEGLEKYSGEYFDHCKPAMPNKIALDEGLAKKLWEFAENEVRL
jgi:hypothetical protein